MAILTLSGLYQFPVCRNPHHFLLQLFKGAHFDLADAFAADVIFLAQVFQRLRLVDQPALRPAMEFAVVQRCLLYTSRCV